eukprot:COSAG01_NODE_3434_length_6100_cov_7.180970_6_plen_110_part_00
METPGTPVTPLAPECAPGRSPSHPSPATLSMDDRGGGRIHQSFSVRHCAISATRSGTQHLCATIPGKRTGAVGVQLVERGDRALVCSDTTFVRRACDRMGAAKVRLLQT